MKGKRMGVAKFPVARIKKIMQVDDDVGKVASSSPVIISKALELFLEDILVESAEITKASGGKKLMPYHLKRLFETNPQYDFLHEMVEGIKDPTAGLTSTSTGSTSSKARTKSIAAANTPSGKGKAKAEDNDVLSPGHQPERATELPAGPSNGKSHPPQPKEEYAAYGSVLAGGADDGGGGGGIPRREQYSYDGGRYSEEDEDDDDDEDEDDE